MKIALIVVGIVLDLVGAVWILQGANVLAGSAMSGHNRWVFIGGALAVIGTILVVVGARLKKRAV